MDTCGNFVHPEVFKQVYEEFKRIHERHPEVGGEAKWAMARDYVWTMALAETSIIKCEMLL